MKPHHEAENYFLDFILKVHKVTKLEQVLGFLTIFCSYKFQNLHHWIFKPETKYKNHFFFETDTINSLLAYVKCQNIFFSVVQVHLLQKFTVRDENKWTVVFLTLVSLNKLAENTKFFLDWNFWCPGPKPNPTDITTLLYYQIGYFVKLGFNGKKPDAANLC